MPSDWKKLAFTNLILMGCATILIELIFEGQLSNPVKQAVMATSAATCALISYKLVRGSLSARPPR
jgi:hypothetical protein